jgi:hypothetical protein
MSSLELESRLRYFRSLRGCWLKFDICCDGLMLSLGLSLETMVFDYTGMCCDDFSSLWSKDDLLSSMLIEHLSWTLPAWLPASGSLEDIIDSPKPSKRLHNTIRVLRPA